VVWAGEDCVVGVVVETGEPVGCCGVVGFYSIVDLVASGFGYVAEFFYEDLLDVHFVWFIAASKLIIKELTKGWGDCCSMCCQILWNSCGSSRGIIVEFSLPILFVDIGAWMVFCFRVVIIMLLVVVFMLIV